MRFNIYHVRFNEFYPLYEEIIASVLQSLEDLGHTCTVKQNTFEENAINILLGSTIFASRHHALPDMLRGRPYIVYQMESLDDWHGLLPPYPEYRILLKNASAIWDYSPSSTSYLKSKGFSNVYHVPPAFHRSLESFRPRNDPDIDVLFFGSPHERREQVIQSLKNLGVGVIILHGVFGKPRNTYISRSKIVLNIHAWDHLTSLETPRISHLLANRVFVISEASSDNPYEDGVVYGSYDQLANLCVEYLRQPERREQVADLGYLAVRKSDLVAILRTTLDDMGKSALESVVSGPGSVIGGYVGLPEDAPRMSVPQDQETSSFPGRPASYFEGINEALLHAVPSAALRILDVGCAAGRLGEALKRIGPPERQVFGIEVVDSVAAEAALRLDAVYSLDVMHSEPPIDDASLDCILFGNVLEQVRDPLSVLRRYKPFLKPDGSILCAISNMQHHTVLSALLANDFQYQSAGLLDFAHVRLFTASSIFKMLLDAGFLPSITQATGQPCPPDLLKTFESLAQYLRLDRQRLEFLLSAYQYIVNGRMLPPVPAEAEPITIVACLDDETRFANNLGASPCVRSGRHQVILLRGARSAADAINAGVSAARHRVVAAVHQDVYLPEGWPARVHDALRLADSRFGPVGVAGVVGIAREGDRDIDAGRVVDRLKLIAPEAALPALATGLDEMALVIPKDSPVRFDPSLGWHNYATDAAMQANTHGLRAVILDAPVLRNSRSPDVLDQDFLDSVKVLAEKWRDRWPLENMVMRIEADGSLRCKRKVNPNGG